MTGQDFQTQGHYGKGQRSYQGHTMTLHTYTPNQCPSQVLTSYTLQFLRYSPEKLFAELTHPDAMCENNTRTVLKGCGVKIGIVNKGSHITFGYMEILRNISEGRKKITTNELQITSLVQGRIQLLSKVGVHIRHIITRGAGGGHAPPGKKINFW